MEGGCWADYIVLLVHDRSGKGKGGGGWAKQKNYGFLGFVYISDILIYISICKISRVYVQVELCPIPEATVGTIQ